MQLYDIVYEIVLLQTCMHVCVDMHMFIINFPGLHICVVQTVVQILGDVSTSIRCSAAVEYSLLLLCMADLTYLTAYN